eukprot:TRINITY_DN9358_c0_g4_i1.p1 TRINITY_DN9358_c0_g4~~TRINITY_DN9358_c0_g4_i1.p1  ORF type:complete len:682 (+),score=124.50 TRINITY_DN9358_c0_g4_i1:52-2097(+)
MEDDAAAAQGFDLLGLALGRAPGGTDFDECVDFELYFDGAVEARDRGEAVPFLRARLCEVFEVLSSDLDRYLWHRDRFVLEVDLGENADEEEPRLVGHLRIGDGVEDEWFVVYLLRRLTSARSDVACRIYDSDGELLLIEAALVAPRWLEPSNAENRCWLRGGLVHFLPRPKPPEPEQISSRHALVRLRASGKATVAKDKVQFAIDARLEGYPQKAVALSKHVARAVLPATVARLLIAYPQLIAVAADHLPPAPSGELTRLRRELSGNEAKVRMDCEGLEEADMVCVGIRFTRCQFARLAGLSCQLPQRFTLRHWKGVKGVAVDNKVMRLGMMLCAGLETAFLQDPEAATAALRWPRAEAAVLEALLPERLPWWYDDAFSRHALSLSPPLALDSMSSRRGFLQQNALDKSFRQCYTEASRNTALASAVDLSAHWRDQDDSEDWLHISEDFIDQEMQARQAEFDAFDQRRGTRAAGASGAGGENQDAEQLRQELAAMGQQVSGLLNRFSEASGLDPNSGARAAGSQENGSDSDSDSERSEKGLGEGAFDVLGNEDDPDDDDSEEGEGEAGDADAFREHLAELDDHLEAALDGDQGPHGAEAMSRDGMPLRSHHVKTHGADPVELDLHTMEHLLASFCTEHRLERGPASLLLGELGLGDGLGSSAKAGANRAPPAAVGLDGMD